MNELNSDCTKVLSNIQSGTEKLFNKYPVLSNIIEHLRKNNASCYIVGGAVRDIILEYPVKDIDIEVHGISLEVLEHILQPLLPVNLVGKSFGVLKSYQYPIDFSIPRSDSSGRHPHVELDPKMGIEAALKRRDLTMNAMAISLPNRELIDPFEGLQDIEQKILRTPDNKLFIEDPLRFYRVMQFAARFNMSVSPELSELCKSMDIKKVSLERIELEFDKMFLQAERPSLGLRWLNAINRIEEILPELAYTLTTRQEPDWHPEIYVFEHLMQTLDAAANIIRQNSESAIINDIADKILVSHDAKLLLLYATLCHDLGKATTTRIIEGRLRSWGHAEAGVIPTKRLLKRITMRKKLIDNTAQLVKYHMHPSQFIKQKVNIAAYKRLASRLGANLNIGFLGLLFLADIKGRNGASHQPLRDKTEEAVKFIAEAEKAGVLYNPEPALLVGHDLLGLVKPGPEMGEILKKSYQLQINKNITDKTELINKIVKIIKK